MFNNNNIINYNWQSPGCSHELQASCQGFKRQTTFSIILIDKKNLNR
jgi:hypothetical protein